VAISFVELEAGFGFCHIFSNTIAEIGAGELQGASVSMPGDDHLIPGTFKSKP
jgi:hypothetical protein